MQRKIAQDAARVENMMLRYNRQAGAVITCHTIHDVAFRAGLGTGSAKKAVAYLHDIGAISAEIRGSVIMYSIKGQTK